MNREAAQQNFDIERPHIGSHDEKAFARLEHRLQLNQELLADAVARGDKDSAALIEQDTKGIIDEIAAIRMEHVAEPENLIHDEAERLNKNQYLN
jgi:hypothetical protein